jgi:hypothetical protein
MKSDMDLAVLALASPVYAIKGLCRLGKKIKFWKVSYATEIPCHTSGQAISLVGMHVRIHGGRAPVKAVSELPFAAAHGAMLFVRRNGEIA